VESTSGVPEYSRRYDLRVEAANETFKGGDTVKFYCSWRFWETSYATALLPHSITISILKSAS
jgi:hypothetical protein